jgi:hypothetical protein
MTAIRNRRTFRRAAWLAVFALLLQSFIPAFHHPATMALAGTLSLGDAKNLCVAPGSAPVEPGDQDKTPHHHLPACAICQAVHAIGGFAPPAPALLVVARDFGTLIPTAPTFVLPFQRPTLRQQPRAPPILI